jgi:Uma2 family endonuclease
MIVNDVLICSPDGRDETAQAVRRWCKSLSLLHPTACWVARRLVDAVERAEASCEVYADGVNVRVDAETIYCPDAMVRCGEALPGDTLKVTDPTIVVEVASSSSEPCCSTVKLAAYFRMPSVRHYLIVLTEHPMMVHHARGEGDAIQTRILTGGALPLDPPGIVLEEWWPGA